jgi:hypothetical protein
MIISDVSNINKRSSILIDVICDCCNIQSEIRYISYTRNGNKDGFYICRKCKTEKTNIEKYGVKNPSQSKEVKDKKKATLINNWGVDHPSKSKEINEKKKNTTLNNYGVENPFQSNTIKEKIKETNLEKYGVKNPSQSKEVKDKKKATLLNNWGVDHPLKSKEIIEKIKNSNLKNWGCEWTLQNKSIKDKIKETNIEKFGVDNPMKSDIVMEKIINNNRERWGVDHFYQTEEFKKLSSLKNKEKYGSDSYKRSNLFYSKTILGKDEKFIEYLGNSISKFSCDNGHTFEIKADNYHSRIKNGIGLCTVCNPIGDLSSIKEKELFEFVKSIYIDEVIQSYRDGLEIDIYLPNLKIGFEFNGLYWHSDEYKDKNYHLNKTNYFKEKDIRIIHIWEDDWSFKRPIIESQIKSLLGINERIYARKCYVKELKNVSDFLNNNHIQGSDNSNIKLGLFYNDKLISVMTFNKLEGRKKMNDGEYNLSRFCNKLNTNVVGGASKLLKHFIIHNNPLRIVSYADKDWSNGGLYEKLGFSIEYETKPDYKYVIGGVRKHKSNYRKSNIGGNLSESKEMKKRGVCKIWDCGKIKFDISLS